MVTLLRTRQGYYNWDHIKRITEHWGKKPRGRFLRIEFANDRVEEADGEFNYLDIEPLLPSPPGYWLLQYWPHGGIDGESMVSREQIIAWQLDRELGYHRVITAGSCVEDDRPFSAILSPDGQVDDPGDQHWPNETEWLKDIQQKAEREEANERQQNKADSPPGDAGQQS